MSIHPEVAAGWGKRKQLEKEIVRLKATSQSLKNQLKQSQLKEQHNGTSQSNTRV